MVIPYLMDGLALRSNSAMVGDVCAAALRACYNAPHRER
jgi:hypothetical protein